jgi:hypothetical protein
MTIIQEKPLAKFRPRGMNIYTELRVPWVMAWFQLIITKYFEDSWDSLRAYRFLRSVG